MAAVIEMFRTRAYLAHGRWHSADAKLAAYLNAISEYQHAPASEPNSDNWLAQAIADQEGGKVIELNPRNPAFDEPDPPDLVY